MKVVAVVACGLLAIAGARSAAVRPDLEVLIAARGLPRAFTSQLLDTIGYAETGTGESLVLDRRSHVVWTVDAKRATWRKVVLAGEKLGQIAYPTALAVGPGDQFVVADVSQGADRLQWFDLTGKMAGAFWLPDKHSPPMIVLSVMFNGIGALHFTGESFYVGYPFRGSLISEVDLKGLTVRQIGLQRTTGQESDPELHLALNSGVVAADPTGGFYYVFQAGEPLFRKYDADGRLVFERHSSDPECVAQAGGSKGQHAVPRAHGASGRCRSRRPPVDFTADRIHVRVRPPRRQDPDRPIRRRRRHRAVEFLFHG
jgi:hypothetical protein